MKIFVCCGKGNKGGDGLSAVRHLFNHGWKVTVILLSENISKDARHHLALLQKMKLPILVYPQERIHAKRAIQNSTILIDALIGYHLVGAPRGVFKEVMEIMNATERPIIAYDLPSGVEPTTGECFTPCIQATTTLSLALPKKAFRYQKVRKTAGKVFIADIGIPSFLYEKIAPHSRPSLERHANSLVTL